MLQKAHHLLLMDYIFCIAAQSLHTPIKSNVHFMWHSHISNCPVLVRLDAVLFQSCLCSFYGYSVLYTLQPVYCFFRRTAIWLHYHRGLLFRILSVLCYSVEREGVRICIAAMG